MKQSNFWRYVSLLLIILLCGCAPKKPHVIDLPPCPPPAKPLKDIEVALVLGIGGFRGVAHLGVIEVLEKEGVPIDLIVGSSAGSIIGAFYADTPNVAKLRERLLHLSKKDIWTSASLPLSGIQLEEFLAKNLCATTFEQLKIPLVTVSTDLLEDKLFILRSGPLVPAIHASSALPHFFKPVQLYGHTLVDGGVMSPVPIDVARKFKPKLVISVNIMAPCIKRVVTKTKLGLLKRAIDISYYKFACMESTFADINIHPNLVDYGPFDDKCNKEVYLKGKEAAQAAVQQIRREMQARGIQPRYPSKKR